MCIPIALMWVAKQQLKFLGMQELMKGLHIACPKTHVQHHSADWIKLELKFMS